MPEKFKFYSYADGDPTGCQRCHLNPIVVQVVDYDTVKVIELICHGCMTANYEEHPDSTVHDTIERRRSHGR